MPKSSKVSLQINNIFMAALMRLILNCKHNALESKSQQCFSHPGLSRFFKRGACRGLQTQCPSLLDGMKMKMIWCLQHAGVLTTHHQSSLQAHTHTPEYWVFQLVLTVLIFYFKNMSALATSFSASSNQQKN